MADVCCGIGGDLIALAARGRAVDAVDVDPLTGFGREDILISQADLDRYAQRVLQTFGTPGMTVAIVEQGKPYVVRSYGVRKMGDAAKVDEHTLFAIGSTTKAFTTALLAMLVDEGKLTWETKVADVASRCTTRMSRAR